MKGARILLGITGGIAAYKAASLTSALVQKGAVLDVVMTAEAERFVAPLTFASLTGRPVYTSLWDLPERIAHIRLVREAQAVAVVPATANAIAKLALGIADDLLSTMLLAARIPIVIAAAMNAAMYEHQATQQHLAALRERGCLVVEPEIGYLAEGEHAIGRLAREEYLIDAIARAVTPQSLRGTRVAITAGATREAFDPVRFVSNASTGATGIALAREAWRRGAEVRLILGPTFLAPPFGVTSIAVTSAQQMLDTALERAADADIVIGTAAVCDWRPAELSARKRRKEEPMTSVRFERTPDVLATLAERNGARFLVGFAAETENHESNAREKLRRKKLDVIAVNDVNAGRGFGTGENALVLLWGEDGRKDLGSADKETLAVRMWDAIEERRACS